MAHGQRLIAESSGTAQAVRLKRISAAGRLAPLRYIMWDPLGTMNCGDRLRMQLDQVAFGQHVLAPDGLAIVDALAPDASKLQLLRQVAMHAFG